MTALFIFHFNLILTSYLFCACGKYFERDLFRFFCVQYSPSKFKEKNNGSGFFHRTPSPVTRHPTKRVETLQKTRIGISDRSISEISDLFFITSSKFFFPLFFLLSLDEGERKVGLCTPTSEKSPSARGYTTLVSGFVCTGCFMTPIKSSHLIWRLEGQS